MITISARAAEQIKLSEQQHEIDGMKLRIAAKVAVDESIEYGIGFDNQKDDDVVVESAGIEIIVAPDCSEHLNGAHLDFVEIEPNNFNFIFHNPNDPNYKPPNEEENPEPSE